MDPILLPLFSARDLLLPRRESRRRSENGRKKRKRVEAVMKPWNLAEWWLNTSGKLRLFILFSLQEDDEKMCPEGG